MISRREFLAQSAASVLGLSLLSSCGDNSNAPLPDGPPIPDTGPDWIVALPVVSTFAFGITSSDPGTDRITLATRVMATTSKVVVFQPATNQIVRTVESPIGNDGFIAIRVDGLLPGTTYHYAWIEFVNGQPSGRSDLGRFVTSRGADNTMPMRIGAISCISRDHEFAVVDHAGRRRDLDAMIMLGDNVYCDGAETLSEFRDKYQETFAAREYKGLRASTSMIAAWDDHDVDNNWNGENVDAATLRNARQAFVEHLAPKLDAPTRIWRSLRLGAVELFILDVRSERLPSIDQYISPAQMQWLKAGLVASTAMFKVIVNPVPITDMPRSWAPASFLRWEGFAKQREEILKHIDDNAISGLMWLAGDFHLSFIGQVSKSGAGSTQVEVLAGPGAQSANPLDFTLDPPQFQYRTDKNNYLVLAVNPAKRQIDIEYWDVADVPFHVETLQF
jgi:alkaline phosphatase D